MRILWRCISEQISLWRIWAPLLGIAVVLPATVIGMPLVERRLIDSVLLNHRLDLLSGTILLYALLWLLATVLGIVRSLLQTYLDQRTSQRFRQRLFDHSTSLSVAFSHQQHSGQTTALFYNDLPIASALSSSTLIFCFAALVGVAMSVVVMFSLNWQLAVAAGVAPPIAGGLAIWVTRPMRPLARRVQEKAAELSERLQEDLSGIREIVAFGHENRQGRQFGGLLTELLHLRMRLTYMDAVFQAGQSIFSVMVTLTILGYGGYLVLQGQTTVGTLVAMGSLFSQTFQPARQLFGMVKNIQVGLAATERVYTFLDQAPLVVPGTRELTNVDGTVRFEHVGFAYQAGQPVLQDVSFTALPGQTVALVGPSGAGKSTIMSLIARFYDPTSGTVSLDGTDLRDLTLEGLRRHISIVFQDTFLFATTVRENIAFGCPEATEEAIVAAAQSAAASEFIADLPRGLDTQVGQRGVQLSEGQKQRLAIARALLRQPRILILDEPTSALDARSERLLQTALDNLTRGRTTFVIAHRLATVQRADYILVIDGGRVVEQGSHGELLRLGGLYRELHDLQLHGLNEHERRGAGESALALAALA